METLRTVEQAEEALKCRLLAARRSTLPLTRERRAEVKAKAKILIRSGISKKAICRYFSCSYADLK